MRRQPARWEADNPEAISKGHRSFWLNGFASPWQPWAKIVYEFLDARKDPRKLQVFITPNWASCGRIVAAWRVRMT